MAVTTLSRRVPARSPGQFLVQGLGQHPAPTSCRFCRILLVLRTLEVGATSWPKDCARVSSKVEGDGFGDDGRQFTPSAAFTASSGKCGDR